MNIKILLAALILTFCNCDIIAQTNPKTLSKADSVKLEASVLKAANWIVTTDLTKEPEKRKEINGIVLKWYIDNITLNASLVEKLSAMNEGNAELMMIFFAGYSKFFIENKNTVTKFTATKAGLISVMDVYKKGIGVTRSESIEELLKFTAENKLDEYIKTNFE